MSPAHIEKNWPPRSPHEALLSSSTGRQKISRFHDRTSPSPSPLRKSTPVLRSGQKRLVFDGNASVDNEDEEDEETLQLQLAALEAKLKLKRLQQKFRGGLRNCSGKQRTLGTSTDKQNAQSSPQNNDVFTHSSSNRSADVQVPVSPQRKPVVTTEARSPGRVLLGIDKGLKGRNISLKRPSAENAKDENPFLSTSSHGSKIAATDLSQYPAGLSLNSSFKPKSFSEKIAETRRHDKAQKGRAAQLRQQRSVGFDINHEQIQRLQQAADQNDRVADGQIRLNASAEFSRDEVLKATTKANRNILHRSKTYTGGRRAKESNALSTNSWTHPNTPIQSSRPFETPSDACKEQVRSSSSSADIVNPSLSRQRSDPSDSLFEPFSSFHLSKRLLPHDFLTRIFTEKHIFLLPNLLGSIKSPDYSLPEIIESDYIVLAVIASKSDPLNHKGAHKTTAAESTSTVEAADSEQNTNGKYMVLTLTDLKWTVDLFLFTTAYTRFRKLSPGTIVALLNPDIMPPPPGKADTGRFSLKLSSSDDTVLEIGTSRDLSWCKSIRKDGRKCESWIDKRHTEYCEFHVDIGVERTRRGRMEVQGMSAPFVPGGRKRGRTGYFGDRRQGKKRSGDDGLISVGAQYDRGSGSQYFIGPSIPGGNSTAQLLDAEGAFGRGGSNEERMRKRLEEREKEKEIARKLGEGSNNTGSEYLRLRHGADAVAGGYRVLKAPEPVDASLSSLLGNKAQNIHLSPIAKRKTSALSADMSRKLRKTRFVTDKGIKEAGGESLRRKTVSRAPDEDGDEDDALDVV